MSVKDAFKAVREGRCPEFIICDPSLNDRFLVEARRRGVKGSDAEINRALLNLRKEKKLKDCPTARRKKPDPNRCYWHGRMFPRSCVRSRLGSGTA